MLMKKGIFLGSMEALEVMLKQFFDMLLKHSLEEKLKDLLSSELLETQISKKSLWKYVESYLIHFI